MLFIHYTRNWALRSLFLLAICGASCHEQNAAMAHKNEADSVVNVVIPVHGMSCGNCAKGIESIIKTIPGVKTVKADHINGNVTVGYAPSEGNIDTVKTAITDMGYTIPAA